MHEFATKYLQIHPLPELTNNFYSNKHSKLYFTAALQAFMEGLAYEYDRELKEISEQGNQDSPPNLGSMNNQYGYINQYPGYNPDQQQHQEPRQQIQGGDAFSRFQAKQNTESESTFKDLGYNPAHRFSNIKGQKEK